MADEAVKVAEPASSVGDGTPPSRRRITKSGAVLLTVAVLASGALIALALPRAVAPTTTPSLVLDAAAVESALADDRRRAAEAPTGLLVDQLFDAYYRHGNARHFGTSQHSFQHDRRSITRTVALIREQYGEDALGAIQASVVERLDDAFAGRMDDAERAAFLGGFAEMLERYALARDGRWLAPDIVVRALFKAYFNDALARPMTEGLRPIELEAYWGWLALDAHDAPLDRRLEALGHYEEARGREHAEARGVLFFKAGRFLDSAEAFETAHIETGSIRFRNHGLAALAEAQVSR